MREVARALHESAGSWVREVARALHESAGSLGREVARALHESAGSLGRGPVPPPWLRAAGPSLLQQRSPQARVERPAGFPGLAGQRAEVEEKPCLRWGEGLQAPPSIELPARKR
ncbi:MAG TPA: hypothetical protein VGY54_22770, partial [Polyangiaceae bacterium]|nr:hypothetical protein [Polyangiaceae bacterium]